VFSGFLVDFVSSPVISGFTSAASVTIAVSQMKNLLGLQVRQKSHLPAILKNLDELFNNISTIKWRDTLLGLSCIFTLLFMKVRKILLFRWYLLLYHRCKRLKIQEEEGVG
jgi:MFS superfamily sulfate permease-like transporter